MSEHYPRDMVGYGASPPHPRWPGSARVAVSFVLNYEEGGEMNVLHGDAQSESYLTEVVGTPPRVGERNLSIESTYEYGSRAGFWRIHRLFTEAGVPITIYGVTMAMARNPEAVKAMVDAGWDIASHGLRWIDYHGMSEAEERRQMQEAIETHTRLTGSRPLGWYCGRHSHNTRRLVVEEGGFLYDSDDYSDDLPFWDTRHGKPQLIIPYTLDANDMRFGLVNGFTAGDQFFNYLREAFDTLYEEGAHAPKMMSIGLHCRAVGRPGRFRALQRFLEHVRAHEDAWLCRRVDIARHWMEHFPPQEKS
ncbi:MAG: allantoinase PuuE [Acuticoccus sp.]